MHAQRGNSQPSIGCHSKHNKLPSLPSLLTRQFKPLRAVFLSRRAHSYSGNSSAWLQGTLLLIEQTFLFELKRLLSTAID